MASAIRVKYLLHWTMDVDCRTKIRQKQFGKATTCKTAQRLRRINYYNNYYNTIE